MIYLGITSHNTKSITVRITECIFHARDDECLSIPEAFPREIWEEIPEKLVE